MSMDDGADDRRTLLGRLILPWTAVPAVVYDRHLTVQVANRLAKAVHPTFRAGANLARSTFLEPERDTPVDPAGTAPIGARLAGELRRALDEHQEDREYIALVGELAAQSSAFAQFWANADGSQPNGVVGFAVPSVGHLVLAYHRFAVPGPDGDTLLLWSGADDESAETLRLLASTLAD
ncbi:hypothetical protein BJK06_04770 [Curtobacterium sp. BH-2-1-1]|nr:hypothetical protein BJK06_04770 [Curtobacterium sp. BH-2-1-1]